jgi:hypothetical protein
MSKVKIVMLSLLAVFALSAAASASASAAGTHQWLINGTLLGTGGTEEIQGNGLPYVQEGQFESSISGLGLHIYCQTAILPSGASNILEGGSTGKAKGKIEFSGCGVFDVSSKGVSETLSACKIAAEPIVAEATGELGSAGALTLKGEPLARFSLEKVSAKEGTCAASGKYEIKGTQVCVLPHYGVALYVHVIECTPGGSTLMTNVESKGENLSFLYLGIGAALKNGGKWLSS